MVHLLFDFPPNSFVLTSVQGVLFAGFNLNYPIVTVETICIISMKIIALIHTFQYIKHIIRQMTCITWSPTP